MGITEEQHNYSHPNPAIHRFKHLEGINTTETRHFRRLLPKTPFLLSINKTLPPSATGKTVLAFNMPTRSGWTIDEEKALCELIPLDLRYKWGDIPWYIDARTKEVDSKRVGLRTESVCRSYRYHNREKRQANISIDKFATANYIPPSRLKPTAVQTTFLLTWYNRVIATLRGKIPGHWNRCCFGSERETFWRKHARDSNNPRERLKVRQTEVICNEDTWNEPSPCRCTVENDGTREPVKLGECFVVFERTSNCQGRYGAKYPLRVVERGSKEWSLQKYESRSTSHWRLHAS